MVDDTIVPYLRARGLAGHAVIRSRLLRITGLGESAVEDRLRDVDVLLCASSMDPASRMDDPEETARTYPRQARTPFNVTGHPALAMMAGLSRGGLPVSDELTIDYDV